jgi:hypothetical protein
MRRLSVLLSCTVLIVLTALIFASKSSAQQSDEIQKYIEQWRLDHQMGIELIQESYLKSTGRYWQGLATHSEAAKPEYDSADKTRPIVDEKSFAADCLNCKPSDQLDQPSWNELFADIVSKLPASLSIEVYDGPTGPGYILHFEYCVDNLCNRRAVSVGPEAWRSTEWVEEKTVIK